MTQPTSDSPILPEDVIYEHVLRFQVRTVCGCGASFGATDFDLSIAQSNARYKLAEHRKEFHDA